MRIIIPVDYIYESVSLPPASRYVPARRDIKKMTEYFGKGSNPKTLANTVKDIDKAVSRFYISVASGWKACADEFYRRCLELGVESDYLEEIIKRAMNDSIDIGNTVKAQYKAPKVDKRVTIEAKPEKVDKPAGTTAKPQKSISNNRKTIDADTGFIITGNNATPFS